MKSFSVIVLSLCIFVAFVNALSIPSDIKKAEEAVKAAEAAKKLADEKKEIEKIVAAIEAAANNAEKNKGDSSSSDNGNKDNETGKGDDYNRSYSCSF